MTITTTAATDAKRQAALDAAGTAKTTAAAVKALAKAAALRGEVAADGEPTNAPLSATKHSDTHDGTMRCYGACGLVLPARRFIFLGRTGAGRSVECKADNTDRQAVNAARVANGLDPIARARADV